MSVASLTISFNGKELLFRQVEALLRQTRRPDEIIVVDNDSSDGTAEAIAQCYPFVKVIRQSKNEGVGGGYSAGLKYAAVCRKHDWVWMLDQDSVPGPELLARLLDTFSTLSNPDRVGLIAPLPVDEISGEAYTLYRWKQRQVRVELQKERSPVVFVDLVISSGSLIRREALETAGLPRKDFFMDFVDFEHSLRLRRHGFEIAVVTECSMPHTIGTPRTVNLFGRPRLWITHAAWRNYYIVRNQVYVIWHEMPSVEAKAFMLGRFAKQVLGTLLFDSEKLTRIKFLSFGLWDGIRGKLGAHVRPGT